MPFFTNHHCPQQFPGTRLDHAYASFAHNDQGLSIGSESQSIIELFLLQSPSSEQLAGARIPCVQIVAISTAFVLATRRPDLCFIWRVCDPAAGIASSRPKSAPRWKRKKVLGATTIPNEQPVFGSIEENHLQSIVFELKIGGGFQRAGLDVSHFKVVDALFAFVIAADQHDALAIAKKTAHSHIREAFTLIEVGDAEDI